MFYERSVQLLADLEEAETVATAGSVAPQGTLKLTCSIAFGVRHLAPAIAEFSQRFPAMRFEIELSDRMVDIVDEGMDLALRIGDVGSQTTDRPAHRHVADGLLRCARVPGTAWHAGADLPTWPHTHA